jgi:hypothetical protein
MSKAPLLGVAREKDEGEEDEERQRDVVRREVRVLEVEDGEREEEPGEEARPLAVSPPARTSSKTVAAPRGPTEDARRDAPSYGGTRLDRRRP